VNPSAEGLCPRCSMENTPAARKATRERIGPWFVYQHRNPAAPGMKFETLLEFVRKDKVKPRSIVRGPTTSQLWRFAAHVKGLSREFGVCYSCGGAIEATTNLCPHCKRLQEPPPNPDVLLESGDGESTRRSAPVVAAPSTRQTGSTSRSAGPFTGNASDANLPTMDDLLPPEEAPPRRPLPKTEPVASFRKPPTGDNFLSARELATAFNLGFNSGNAPQGKSRKKKAHWGRRLFLLFFLAAIAAGAFVWTRPVLRQQAINWGTETWKKVQPLLASKLSSANKAPAKQADDKQPADATAHSTVVVSAPAPESTKVATPPKGTDSQQSASKLVKPNDATAAGSHPGDASPQPGDQVVVNKNGGSAQPPKNPQESAANQSTEKPFTSDQTPAAASAEDAERANALYSQGLDAEQRMDFATAAKCYEQIMKLPKEVWRSDVEVRLRLARYQAEHH